jgi:hypothetical protein
MKDAREAYGKLMRSSVTIFPETTVTQSFTASLGITPQFFSTTRDRLGSFSAQSTFLVPLG